MWICSRSWKTANKHEIRKGGRNEAEKQKKYIENKHELEEAAAKELAEKNAQATDLEQAQVKAAAGSSVSTIGLEFDADLEKLFPSKPVVEKPKDVYIKFDNKK